MFLCQTVLCMSDSSMFYNRMILFNPGRKEPIKIIVFPRLVYLKIGPCFPCNSLSLSTKEVPGLSVYACPIRGSEETPLIPGMWPYLLWSRRYLYATKKASSVTRNTKNMLMCVCASFLLPIPLQLEIVKSMKFTMVNLRVYMNMSCTHTQV